MLASYSSSMHASDHISAWDVNMHVLMFNALPHTDNVYGIVSFAQLWIGVGSRPPAEQQKRCCGNDAVWPLGHGDRRAADRSPFHEGDDHPLMRARLISCCQSWE